MHIFIQIIFPFLLIFSTSAADAQSIVKPGCPSTCGDVKIPYPFGIGNGCYHSKWYEITCTNTEKAFLTKINMEIVIVGYYDSEHSIVLMNPVATNCPGQHGNNKIWSSTNFSGSPYHFSISNKFILLGCGNAQIFDSTNASLAGCSSICKANTSTNGCNGINCCQSSLYLNSTTFYTISFEENTTPTGCSYAFLVAADYISNDRFYSPLTFINNTKQQVLVRMIWTVDYKVNCDDEGHVCRCPWAHVGNPYIRDGCKVVEACANCETDCYNELLLTNTTREELHNTTDGFYCRHAHTHTTRNIIGAIFGGDFCFYCCAVLVLGCTN